MKATLDTLENIRRELEEMISKEATNLFRLARKAEKHGVSEKLVNEIRNEAWELYHNCNSYPERVLDWKFKYETKYAFR